MFYSRDVVACSWTIYLQKFKLAPSEVQASSRKLASIYRTIIGLALTAHRLLAGIKTPREHHHIGPLRCCQGLGKSFRLVRSVDIAAWGVS